MKIRFIAFVVLVLFLQSVRGQEKPQISEVDRLRLAEAFRLSEVVDDRIWKGWAKAPFAVLLVTNDYEFLMRHPQPSPDFTLLGYDSLLKSNVYFRKRIFSKRLQATFPAIQSSSISTIVVGEAENTESKTSTPWVIMLFHEHFHQLQYSQPTYYKGVEALNLAHGDNTGMWMLNYAFPYEKIEVQQQFGALSKLLVQAVTSKDDRATKLAVYLQARREFQQMLSPDDFKYFSFQFWQEGIARYTELQVAELAAARYKPSQAFRALKDFTPFVEVANETRERIINQLLTQQLAKSKREVVYPFGAAEGLLLDKVNPAWRERYLVDRFDTGKYFETQKPVTSAGSALQ